MMKVDDVRKKYIEELIKHLLGPKGGIYEELSENSDPYGEYISGILVPEKYGVDEISPSETDILSEFEEDIEDSTADPFHFVDVPSQVSPKTPPKSFGISFEVQDNSVMDVCVTWGRYEKKVIDGRTVWKRTPYYSLKRVDLSEIDSQNTYELYRGHDGTVEMSVFKMKLYDKGQTAVIITVINRLHPMSGRESQSSRMLFQPTIRVKLLRGKTLNMTKSPFKDDFSFLYRNRAPKARGFMCAAVWRDVDYSPDIIPIDVTWPDHAVNEECEDFIRADVRSEFLPLYGIGNPDFSWKYKKMPCFDAFELSEMWTEGEIEQCLSPIVEAYREWIEKNRETMRSSVPEEYRDIAERLISYEYETLKRIEDGISLLKKDPHVRLAFNFANRVIWLQNRWKNPDRSFIWRPFQLAFLLVSLEPIFNERSKFREYVDLLWIPTGGGKTEAYLAIMAYVMALRRLLHGSGEDISGYGTSVITRYTLRLLTIQQFRRMLRMVTAAEMLRIERVTVRGKVRIGWRPQKSDIDGNFIYGYERFTIGLWVGSGVSPNHLNGDRGALKILSEDRGEETDPAQIIKCPVCGAWLSIPVSGLEPEITHTIHWIAKSDLSAEEINKIISTTPSGSVIIERASITQHDHGLYTITLHIRSNKRRIFRRDISTIWDHLKERGIYPASFSENTPGYFPVEYPNSSGYVDFRIYCPNPEPSCGLNIAHPYPDMEPVVHMGKPTYCESQMRVPVPSTKIPIPAYTVDEQVYHRVPTVVISTVDKIARLPFEPRSAAIFGNINHFHPYIGYFRDAHKDLLPKYSPFWKGGKKGKVKIQSPERTVDLPGFRPPELIIQDELHLISGPLGSMFGIYEAAVENIIERCWRNRFGRKIKTKYIASTATSRRAEHQVMSLFVRELRIFPPHGLDISNNLFARYPSSIEDNWNPERPGRVYMGVSAPGRGPHTPQIRIWSAILKTAYDLRGHVSDDILKHYWTIVGYFNSIRELGGARALYREDVVERLRQLNCGRKLDPLRVYELSSRIGSTEIPIIIEDMERDPDKDVEQMKDAIFTTSMFGTGVDIPHLSVMVVDGQPKTTSSYIQATGRVGRRMGALVVTFYNTVKPRDLSHYEMFTGYHMRLHMEVETPAVAPYSPGAIERGGGPALVGVVRNACDNSGGWYDNDNGWIIGDENMRKYADLVGKDMAGRFGTIMRESGMKMRRDILHLISSKVSRWHTIATEIVKNGGDLVFVQYGYMGYLKKPRNVVLGDTLHRNRGVKIVYENTPKSLRETEETVPFGV